jgi:hypothetical protein
VIGPRAAATGHTQALSQPGDGGHHGATAAASIRYARKLRAGRTVSSQLP